MQRDGHNFLCGSAKALPPGLGTLVCAVQHVGHNNAIVKQARFLYSKIADFQRLHSLSYPEFWRTAYLILQAPLQEK